jgi:hypothetical protein
LTDLSLSLSALTAAAAFAPLLAAREREEEEEEEEEMDLSFAVRGAIHSALACWLPRPPPTSSLQVLFFANSRYHLVPISILS